MTSFLLSNRLQQNESLTGVSGVCAMLALLETPGASRELGFRSPRVVPVRKLVCWRWSAHTSYPALFVFVLVWLNSFERSVNESLLKILAIAEIYIR